MFQDIKRHSNFSKMHSPDNICSREQCLLHPNVRCMDGITVSSQSLPASNLLAYRGPVFPLAISNGFHVDLVRWLRQ